MPHNLSYDDRGQGTSLVLVHGFPLDRRIWANQMDALSKKCRVIAPDLPGFGQSKGDQPFTLDTLADTLHHFLAEIDALPCILAGFSMGGYLAFAYLTKYPTDLKGLALIDTKCEADTTEGKENRNKMIETVRSKGSKAIAEAMEPKMLAPSTLEKNPDVAQRIRAIMEACPPKTIEHALAAMRDRADYRDKLASIAVPTLIIVGENDAITPPSGAIAMNREIPHSKLCVISHAGHLSPLENPEAVTRALSDFLAQT